MAKVFRPEHKVGTFKSYTIVLQSKEPVADYEQFMKDCKEVEEVIKILQECDKHAKDH